MNRPFRALVVFLLAASAARATMVTLVAPLAEVRAGGTVAVELLIVNSADRPVSYLLSPAIDAHLTQDARRWLVTLQGGRGDVSVPAGGFARVPLVFALPAEIQGRVALEVSQPVAARALIDVEAGASAERPTALPSPVAEAASAVPALPAASRLKRYYADRFSGHEPMYFAYGGDRPAAKFQFSMKYRILDDAGPLARRLPALKGLHIAYTQRSLWDITADSSPFYDTSYMPELMLESLAPDSGKHHGITWLGWQAAFQDESNGRDGFASRSLNTLHFRPMLVVGDPDGWRLILRPKFFAYLGDVGNNPDIRRYRGYSELRAIFGKANRLSISVTGRVGERFDKGSLQVDGSYPTEFLTGNFAMYLLAQYWTGYGESLRSYDQRSDTVRFGFSLAR
ncbi:MAG: phospholipase A [Verrucomicrobia bacterium]|nr:phospholipase A [Verrucomicrobiota bacterium]